MLVKFQDIIHVNRTSCKKCVALLYEVPCPIDKKIVKYLGNFGKPMYNLGANVLLKIQTKDGHIIEGKLNKNYIKLGLPKKYENSDWDATTRKVEFEIALTEWIQDLLKITIIKEDEKTNRGLKSEKE